MTYHRNSAISRKTREYAITNVVTTTALNQAVDAQNFNRFPWGTYDMEYYGGRCGYVKDAEIRGRVTVFLSGKMISTGAKSVEESVQQLNHTMEILAREGLVKITKLESKVQNIVALAKFDSFDLIKITETLPDTIYEPKQFPSIIHKTTSGPTCLIFGSGKVVIVGSKSENQLRLAISELTKRLSELSSG